jgi:hypothetical protein
MDNHFTKEYESWMTVHEVRAILLLKHDFTLHGVSGNRVYGIDVG